jgi:putative methyltransferase (TIGR04325 family)
MAAPATSVGEIGKYLQPGRYIRRLRSLAASFSSPITGYEEEALIEFVFQKTLVLNRVTALDLGMGSERLLLAVSLALRERTSDEATGVLDFGGACGIHFKLASLLFPEGKFRWAVVETPTMVKRARVLETDSLRFFEDIKSAQLWLGEIALMNSNSALQYVESPLQTMKELLERSPEVALWERMMLSNAQTQTDLQRSMLFDHGPGATLPGFRNRPVVQKITRLSRADFLTHHEAQYRLRCSAVDQKFSTYLFSRDRSKVAREIAA